MTRPSAAKSLALVTCLYDLAKRGSAQHRTVDGMLGNAEFVLGLDRELVIFTDPELEVELLRRREGRPTKVVSLPFEKLLRSDRAAAVLAGRRPLNANPRKDTSTYVQLTWTKFAMLEAALEITSSSHVGWIDLGITHVAVLPPEDVDIFANPSDRPKVHVLRTFDRSDVSAPDYWMHIQGHVAAGLVVGARGLMRDVIGDFWLACDRARSRGLAPLEQELLSYVVGQRPGRFAYSFGDYEDILRNHDERRGGEGHCQWIVADALARGRSPAMVKPNDLNFDSKQPQPLLGLVMIVKDEAHGIAETLNSFAPYIDYWTIMDTGSTDDTVAIVQETLHDVPGEVLTGDFVDFSTARNRALSHHGEKTRWTIMPDADDRLVGGEKLREQLPADDLGAEGFMVNLRRGHLDYYLPLVLRSSCKLRYVGRVHEHVDRMIEQKLVGAEVHQTPPSQSREASKKRWERDARLLEEDLKANPLHSRALFYLAQTYECLDDKPKAIELYQRRIAVGGWIDETFEAHLRLAGACRAVSDHDQAARWLLKAHTLVPDRAEPLLKLAQHYHSKDEHALAFLFADRGAEMPYSKSTLWVDHNAQDECSRIASIHGYYLKDSYAKRAGAEHTKDCVRRDPGNAGFRSNWAFYTQDVTRTFKARRQHIDFTPPSGWNASNPSVHYDAVDKTLRCVVRTTNYKIVDGCYLTPDDNIIYTRNWMLELTSGFTTVNAVEMVDRTEIPRSSYPCHGFEDCRLYRVKDQLMCSATVCDFDLSKPHEGPREIVAMELSSAYEVLRARAIRGSWSHLCQKNWMPFEHSEHEEWVYAAINDAGQTTKISPDRAPASLNYGRLRGGSQLVKLADGKWLAVVHDVAFPGGRTRFYLHRFVLFDEQVDRVLAMTDPFFFEKLGIEFCCGLARIEQQLVASFSVDDSSANFAIFDLNKILAAMDDHFII